MYPEQTFNTVIGRKEHFFGKEKKKLCSYGEINYILSVILKFSFCSRMRLFILKYKKKTCNWSTWSSLWVWRVGFVEQQCKESRGLYNCIFKCFQEAKGYP